MCHHGTSNSNEKEKFVTIPTSKCVEDLLGGLPYLITATFSHKIYCPVIQIWRIKFVISAFT